MYNYPVNNLCFLNILVNNVQNNTSHLYKCQKYCKPQSLWWIFFFLFYHNWEIKHKRLSSVYLKVVKRKEGLRLSSLFLYVLNAISAGLLRVNNDGIHVFSKHLRHSNLILLLSRLAQVNKTAILNRGRVCLRKWHYEVDQTMRKLYYIQVPLPQSPGTVFWCSPWSQPCAADDCFPAGRF